MIIRFLLSRCMLPALLFVSVILNAKDGNRKIAQPGQVAVADKFRLDKLQHLSAGRDLYLVENKGQITDQDGKQRHDIQFKLAAAGGLSVFIGNGAIHYQFSNCENNEGPEVDPKSKFQPADSNPVITNMYRMDVELVGANKNAKVITEQQQAYYENYFTAAVGENGVTAHAYGRVTYKDIYPNIDWVFYLSGRQLKHEFVVRQGGRVSDIKLKYGGATCLEINDDGSLEAITPQGLIKESAPYTYQEDGDKVESSFKLDGDVLSYTVGEHTGILVIDPSLNWGTYYGSHDIDRGYGLATDGSGNVYMTGRTVSAGLITSGAFQSFPGGSSDGFLAKFDNTGAILWATYYGGVNFDEGRSVAVDGSGNVYMTGYSQSSSGISTGGVHQTGFGGGADAFVAKFNSTGVRQWATYFGGSANDLGFSIATDGSGNVYLTGYTESSTGIATSGAHQATISTFNDAYLAKFSSAGALLWATYYGGTSTDEGWGVVVDDSGYVYFTGFTGSPGLASSGAYQTAIFSGIDGFLAKFSTAGVRQWATYYGGNNYDKGLALAEDGSGNIYVTGYTMSTAGIATTGVHRPIFAGTEDAFLMKFNSAGARQWGTYYGGASTDLGYGVAADSSGYVYITGPTNSPSGIATAGAHQATNAGGKDVFLAKFNGAGILLWGTYYGGANEEEGWGVAADNAGNAFIMGYTMSSTSIATAGTFQTLYGGGLNDAFLASFIVGGNNAPVFVNTSPQNLMICINATAQAINSLLTVNDADTGQILTWTVVSSPLHGSLSGVAAYTATVTGSVITPTGMTYTPTSGYTGMDTFIIQISDGVTSATMKINVTINAIPTITGVLTFPVSAMTILSPTLTGGTWTSATTGVATVGSSNGMVIAVSVGTSVISYAVSGCLANVTVTVTPVTALFWYSSTTSTAGSNLANWWSNSSNTGYHPGSFTTTNTTWIVQSFTSTSGSTTFTGNIHIVAGGTFACFSGSTTTVGGNWKNAGTFIRNGGTTVVFDGSSGNAADTISGNLTGPNRFNSITFNSPSAPYTFLGNPADVDGNFLQSSGIVTAPSANLNVRGNFTQTGGNFKPNGGTVTFTGTSSTINAPGMTISGANCFNNLSFNAAATSTYTIAHSLWLMGTFNNITANGTIVLGSNTMWVGGNWINAGPFVVGARHIIMNGTTVSIRGKM